tara:strand:- start:4252 stop:4416 length:165 start_codon:yes stop_codon:yes gene_type:complete
MNEKKNMISIDNVDSAPFLIFLYMSTLGFTSLCSIVAKACKPDVAIPIIKLNAK